MTRTLLATVTLPLSVFAALALIVHPDSLYGWLAVAIWIPATWLVVKCVHLRRRRSDGA